MKCKKFDNWIKSIPVNPRGYTKKSGQLLGNKQPSLIDQTKVS